MLEGQNSKPFGYFVPLCLLERRVDLSASGGSRYRGPACPMECIFSFIPSGWNAKPIPRGG